MRIFLLLTVLIAACAPQEHDLGTEAGPQAGAAAVDVGVNEEPLLASCTNTSYCNAMKSFINGMTGVTWSWSGACSSTATWYGTAPGGRTGTATPISGIAHRNFSLSQDRDGILHCYCNSTNNPSCSY